MNAKRVEPGLMLENEYGQRFVYEGDFVEPESLEQPSPFEFIPGTATDHTIDTDIMVQSGNANVESSS